MRILLVDDHILFREGLEGLLNSQPDMKVIGHASSVNEAIEAAHKWRPDLILMDFGMPDGNGLMATRAILAELPEMNIVFLTVHEEDERLFEAIRAGARGYLLKNVPVSRLLEFLRGVEQGKAAISRTMVSRVMKEFARVRSNTAVDPSQLNELTSRELEVLEELATGATNREIANNLSVAENTVKNHVRNILTKLNLKNRREAADLIRQNNDLAR